MEKKIYNPKDFIDIPDMDMYESANFFQVFIDQMDRERANAFDITAISSIGSKMNIIDRYTGEVVKVTSFVTNNYLGMNTNSKVVEAALKATQEYGIGTCASPVIGGFLDINRELELKLAKLHGQEDAILYTSGYTANIGVFQLLFNKMDLVIIDMLVHASIHDGLGNTNVKMFKHNDVDYLEHILKHNTGKHRNMAIVVDGVYSQDGDLPRLPEICELAEKYGVFVFVDDAHGVGVFGNGGKGTADYLGVENKIDMITGTFSKSMGTSGGYAAGSKQLIKYLKHFSRSNTFSASVIPPVVAAASKAIDLFTEEPEHIKTLWKNTNYIKKILTDAGFDIGKSQSPITPVMIRDDEKTKLVARELLNKGIYIIPATYPAVKLKNSRLRLNVTSQHTKEDLDYFCEMLIEVNKMFNFAL